MRYLHLDTHSGGHLTIAYEIDNSRLTYGVAFCSPNDQFDRRMGRLISSGRLEKRNRELIYDETDVTRDTIAKMVLADIVHGGYHVQPYRRQNDRRTPLWLFNK